MKTAPNGWPYMSILGKGIKKVNKCSILSILNVNKKKPNTTYLGKGSLSVTSSTIVPISFSDRTVKETKYPLKR